MYILYCLKQDDRLLPGTTCVQATLEAYQRNHSLNSTISFPVDLHINGITVVLDDRSPSHTVGDNAAQEPTINTGTTDGLVRDLSPYIRTFSRSKLSRNKSTPNNHNPSAPSKQCKCCYGIGYCITDPEKIYYTLVRTNICLNFIKRCIK